LFSSKNAILFLEIKMRGSVQYKINGRMSKESES